MHWKQILSGPGFKKTLAILSGVTIGSGLGFTYTQTDTDKVFAAWTKFEPSVRWDTNWDKRDPAVFLKPMKNEWGKERYDFEKSKLTSTATRNLFLIRHGKYCMDGDNDEVHILTEVGRKQAEIVGRRLAELQLPYDFMLNSTMTRARETANIMYKYLGNIPRKECAMLCEGAPIPPEPPVGRWKPEQSFYRDGARIEAAFRKYFHRADPKQTKDSYEIMVCHANVIRYFVCRAMQFPPEAWLRISLNHCSITWFMIQPSGRVVIRTLGDSGHLPKEYLTSS